MGGYNCQSSLYLSQLPLLSHAMPHPLVHLCVLHKQPNMRQLCEHFQVSLMDAHDARADSAALAHCVAEAWRKGVMM